MEELARRLSSLPQAERDATLLFYSELFDEAGPENEFKVIEELGSPYQVAAKIQAEFAAEQTLGQNGQNSQNGQSGGSTYQWSGYQHPKRRISWLWYLLIGILAAPVALPVAIVAVAAIFSVIIAGFAGIISLGAVVFFWVLAAVILFFVGIYNVILFPAGGITMIGISLLMVAIGLLIFLPVRFIISVTIDLITRGTAWTFNKLSGGAKA